MSAARKRTRKGQPRHRIPAKKRPSRKHAPQSGRAITMTPGDLEMWAHINHREPFTSALAEYRRKSRTSECLIWWVPKNRIRLEALAERKVTPVRKRKRRNG